MTTGEYAEPELDRPPSALADMRRQYGRAYVVERDPRVRALVAFGDQCMSYSTLQPGLQYVFSSDGEYLAFRAIGQYRVMLGDPVCAPESRADMLQRFHESCVASGVAALALHISPQVAAVALQIGFVRQVIGVEIDVALSDFSLRGRAKAYLRRACNRARRTGLQVRESTADTVAPADKRRVSESWLRKKGGNQLEFLIRPCDTGDEFDVRTFCGFIDGRLVGFVSFDPLYRDGTIVGYYQQHMRYCDEAPAGTIDCITTCAMSAFREQGYQVLKLGLAPLSQLQAHRHLDSNPRLSGLIRRTYERADQRYPYRGAYFHKSRYRGLETPVFLLEKPASRTGGLGLLGNLIGLYTGAPTS